MYELQDLGCVVGDSLTLDEDALGKGLLVVEFDWPVGEEKVPLRAIFPDTFPRNRPLVQLRADPATFPKRHCNPMDGTLCLLGRDSSQWPNQWTLARLLKEQLAHALHGTGDEDAQGEPAEYWWNLVGLPDSYCLVDSGWSIGEATSGTLTLRFAPRHRPGALAIEALVKSVRDAAGTQVCAWNGATPANLVKASEDATIPWIYLHETPLPTPEWRRELLTLMGRLPSRPHFTELNSPMRAAQVFAIAYPSELEHGKIGLGWLFGLFHGNKKHLRDPNPEHLLSSAAILPTLRAGESDLGARVPAVSVLRSKRVAVIGLGAIGAPLALELARAGCCELHLLDYDIVEPGNSIRWPLGASAWGIRKAPSLTAMIEKEYPWTHVRAHSHVVGAFGDMPDPLEGDDAKLKPIISQVDVVIDASASNGVLNVLGDYCRELGLPLIAAYASPPVGGGEVVRFAPASGCPTCRQFAHETGLIPHAPGFGQIVGLQQPPGCAERTFTGASFDLQELSLQAVRLAIDTLREPLAATESLVQVLSLVDAQGQRIPPLWTQNVLPKSAQCRCGANP